MAKLELQELDIPDMKPRLFSTLRALHHENPLVTVKSYHANTSIINVFLNRDCRVRGLSLACSAVFLNDVESKMFER